MIVYVLQVFYPKNIEPSVVSPEKMYKSLNILTSGVFAIEKSYDDNFIFVPLEFAKNLLNYGERITSYEIYIDEEHSPTHVQNMIKNHFGEKFIVKTGDELHSDFYKILKIEKFFVFIILTSIIAIASINIFFSLTMLVIEKRKDITLLFVHGASQNMVRNIFLIEGSIIAFLGAIVGVTIGLSISWVQQKFGIVGIGIQSAIVSSYPIKIQLTDILFTIISIIIITFLAAILPAIKASKTYSISSL